MTKRIFWFSFFAIFLIQVSPLVSESAKFLCQNLGGGIIKCGIFQFREYSFFIFRFVLIVLAVILYGLALYYQSYLPQNRYDEGRKATFDALLAPALDQFLEEGLSLRINVMKSKQALPFLGIAHKLQPIYHYGFEPKHRDSHLSFWAIKIFKWAQGNCGQAFLTEQPQLADLTEGVPFEYHLPKWKIQKTDYIKGIISIPIFEVFKENSPSKVIGVINVDTNDEGLVRRWIEDENCLKSIVEAFENHAKIVSFFI